MKEIIRRVVDGGELMEVARYFAPNLIVGFARMNGQSVGIVAQQPRVLAGALDINSADKGARFIRFCDAFNIPLITFCDTSGYLPGVNQEHGGIIRHGAKMLFAVSEATVPRICVVVRKAYGGGYLAMSGAPMNPDAVIALPTAKPALMGPAPAVNAIHYNRIKDLPPKERVAFIQAKRNEYEDNIDPYAMANEFFFEAITPATQLRQELIQRLEAYSLKESKGVERRCGVIPG
jgi:acetyl-CoA carboxylase carboxyltransferase component